VFICHPCILFDEVTFPHFLLGCCFLIVEFWKFFIFLDISPLLDIWFVSIFSMCASCLLILFGMSPPEQKFYIYVHLINFLKIDCAFWLSSLKALCLIWRFSTIGSFKSFIVLQLYLIHFDLIFGDGMRFGLRFMFFVFVFGFFFAYGCLAVIAPFIETAVLPSVNYLSQKSVDSICMGISLDSLCCSTDQYAIYLQILPCLDLCSMTPPIWFLFFKIVFDILVPLPFHINFRISLLTSTKILVGFWEGLH